MKLILDLNVIDNFIEDDFHTICDGFDLNSKLNNSLSLQDKIRLIEKVSKKVSKDKLIFIGLSNLGTDKDLIEAIDLHKANRNIVIVFNSSITNIGLCQKLFDKGIITALSPCLSLSQGIIFAKNNVNFIFIPIGKLEDISINAIELVSEVKAVIDNYPDLYSQVITRSIRSLIHINESAKLGVDGSCISSDMLKKMLNIN